MSCTVMYQPYANVMSYSCDRPSTTDKAPSPPESSHSDNSSYNSPGPLTGGSSNSNTNSTANLNQLNSAQQQQQLSRQQQPLRPLTPQGPSSILIPPSQSSSRASATVTSAEVPGPSIIHHHHHHQQSQQHHQQQQQQQHHHHHQQQQSQQQSSSSSSNRTQYLSANCLVIANYNGDPARVVEEHFSRALSAPYSNDSKGKQNSPMTQRNFPPSFWNSNYQPPPPAAAKPLVSYGATDFYGNAVDYGPPPGLGLSHHHQTDPWHYSLPPPHQGYHHRPADITYSPMPSTSRFNAAQFGSMNFLLAGSSAGRFGMPGPSQCGVGVKGDVGGPGGPWGGGRYHHEASLSDFSHLADYSHAAAAAHYSNMTAGLETTVQETSKAADLYWI